MISRSPRRPIFQGNTFSKTPCPDPPPCAPNPGKPQEYVPVHSDPHPSIGHPSPEELPDDSSFPLHRPPPLGLTTKGLSLTVL